MIVMAAYYLTSTHREILTMYADGREQPEIARMLGCSVSTIKKLTREACWILGARNRTHAVAVAWRAKVIL